MPSPAPFALPQLAAPQFRADASAPASAAKASGPWGVLSGDWQNQNLLGDMWGLRPALAKYGVTLTILENVEVFGNLSGGVQQGLEPKGLTTVTLQMDTEKAFGLNGGTLNVSGLQVYGGQLNDDDLLVLQTLSDIDAPVGVRLWELWYQQKFGDKFDIKVGEQSLDEEFIIAPSANSLFINGVSGWPGLPTVDLPGGGPAYPLAGLGVRGRVQVTDSVTVLAGVFNGSPIPFDSPNTPRSNPHGVSFPVDVGTLAIAELQYAYGSSAQGKANADGPLPGNYKIGAWYNSYKFDDQQTDTIGLPLASPLSNGMPATPHGDFSLYGVMDQMIWRSKDNSNRSLNVFFRPMFTPYQDRNLVSASINAGLALACPVAGARQRCLRRRNGDRVGEQRRVQLRPADAILPACGLHADPLERDLYRGNLSVSGSALVGDSARRPIFHQSGSRNRQPGRAHAADQERVRDRPADERELLTD